MPGVPAGTPRASHPWILFPVILTCVQSSVYNDEFVIMPLSRMGPLCYRHLMISIEKYLVSFHSVNEKYLSGRALRRDPGTAMIFKNSLIPPYCLLKFQFLACDFILFFLVKTSWFIN